MSKQLDTLRWAGKIGERLRHRRRTLELSLEELSRLSGSSVPTLSNIERGKRDVKLSTLVALSNSLRIDLSALFNESGHEDKQRKSSHGSVGYDLDDD